MTHFSDPELRQWSGSGPGADRERVIAHIASCPACAARYAAAIRTRPMTEPAADTADEVAAFVRAGYNVPARQGSVVPFPVRGRRAFITLATAAALIAAIAIPYTLRLREQPADVTLRGSRIQSLAPAGAVAEGTEFAWSTDLSPAAFRLEIGDATGIVYTERTTASRTRLQPDAWRRLSPGVDYWWTVTALDREGHEITASSREAFTIRRR